MLIQLLSFYFLSPDLTSFSFFLLFVFVFVLNFFVVFLLSSFFLYFMWEYTESAGRLESVCVCVCVCVWVAEDKNRINGALR